MVPTDVCAPVGAACHVMGCPGRIPVMVDRLVMVGVFIVMMPEALTVVVAEAAAGTTVPEPE